MTGLRIGFEGVAAPFDSEGPKLRFDRRELHVVWGRRREQLGGQLFQRGLPDFPGASVRHLEEMNGEFRNPRRWQSVTTVLEDLDGGTLSARIDRYKCDDRFAEDLMRRAHDRDLDDLWKLLDNLFDFSRTHTGPATLDDVPLALDNVDEPVRVDASQITRVETAFSKKSHRFVGIAPVTRRDIVARRDNFAYFGAARLDGTSVGSQDFKSDGGQACPDRPWLVAQSLRRKVA